MLEIREITECKENYIFLLIIGDEQEDMIDRYLQRSRLFIGYIDGTPCACCAVTIERDGIVEIKNLAVLPQFRMRGIGRSMLQHVENIIPSGIYQLGTGETPATLHFYKRCGYAYHHRIPDFFTDNYDHPIIEEGIRLKDMVYLRKTN